DQYLVALDLAQGSQIWEKPVKPAAGEVVVYLACGQGKLVLVTSGDKDYHVYAFDGVGGNPVWQAQFPWDKDNHGAHMARPAIVGHNVYVRPKVFDLLTGRVRAETIPGGGCGTYAATDKALFFRNSNVTVWDVENGQTTSWERLRPDCWLSTIPADGLLLSPEAGGGCSCGSWLETSLAFIPKNRE
ncbi:MAG: PQQ-binding-like beta-propeller repeat protein, partial [Chloroflexi bacterium]|nr:PQQ-binding-like beta-propeller repeat protein [Chloroflexota bacterium]